MQWSNFCLIQPNKHFFVKSYKTDLFLYPPSDPSEPELLNSLVVEPSSGVKNVSLQFNIKNKQFFDFEKRDKITFKVSSK
jgi:hypothetical protein